MSAAAGHDGPQGRRGRDGVQGEQGFLGPQGRQGVDGADSLLAYRVALVEEGHRELSGAVGDLRDFATSIKAYARFALFVWPIAQAAITALVVVGVMQLVGK